MRFCGDGVYGIIRSNDFCKSLALSLKLEDGAIEAALRKQAAGRNMR
jgi:hypothetical protein